MRLRAVLGDDAFWVPPRLWAYAAENQPDGDFSEYTDAEIAALIGYSKDASSMLQALLRAGFMDDGNRLHDWQEHNGFHKSFSERASKAAKAMHAKKKEQMIRDEMIGDETSSAPSMLQAGNGGGKVKRRNGIPSSEAEVIEFGATLNPPVSKENCQRFWSHYEGQARTNANGEVFWVTSGNAVVTNWKAKLPSFGEPKHAGNSSSKPNPFSKHLSASAGTANEGRAAAYANAKAIVR